MQARTSSIAVFVVDLLRGYGSERYTVQLVNALASRGEAVDLVFQEMGTALRPDIDPRIRLVNVGTRNPFATIGFLFRYLKNVRPRALFTVMEKPSLLGVIASFFAGYKNIVPTLHFDIDAYASLEFGMRRKVLRFLIAVFYRYAPAVVAVSNGVAQAFQHWVGPHTRIVTIFNGFDFASLRRRAQEEAGHAWLREKTVPVILGCGRLVPLKGFDVLIRAFALVRQSVPARLIILGEGPLRHELLNLIGSLHLHDDVALPGYTENLQAWLAKSDVFVLSSRSEGFGNVVVEALAAGVRVVCTDCPSGPRAILENGKLGTLVPVDDVEAMAHAIKTALTTSGDLSVAAKVAPSLNSRFSLDVMTDAYLALAKELSP